MGVSIPLLLLGLALLGAQWTLAWVWSTYTVYGSPAYRWCYHGVLWTGAGSALASVASVLLNLR